MEMLQMQVPGGGAAAGSVNISAGTLSQDLTAFVFSNSGGVSFGLNASTITATVATNYQSQGAYLTTAMASNRGSDFVQAAAVFAGTNASGTIASGGISISVAAPGAGGGIAAAAGTQTGTSGTVLFNNSNGITFGMSASTQITASHNGITNQSDQTIGFYASANSTGQSSSGTIDARSFSIAGKGIVSVGSIGGIQGTGIIISAVQSQQPSLAISAGTQSVSTGTLVFANANGITFGMSGSTQITASHNGLTTARASNDAVGLNTAQTNVTWTVNSSGISINAGGYLTTAMASNRGTDFIQATAAFAGTNASGTIASNGISVSVAAPGGGAGVTETMWYPYNEAQNVVGAVGNGTLHMNPLPANADKKFDRVGIIVTFSNASNTTGSMSLSMYMAFYTQNGSTLSLAHSQSGTQTIQYAGNNSSASNRGIRIVTFPWTTTIPVGFYCVGMMSKTATAGGNASISQMLLSNIASGLSGMMQAATNRSVQWPLGLGVMSVSTAALPASVAYSALDGTGTSIARAPTWFAQSGTA